MVIDTKEIEKIIKGLRISNRVELTGRKDQSRLSEFLRIRFPPESRKHRLKKMEIANMLKGKGKNVKIESSFVLGGIRVKPDIRYFEGDRCHIIEVELGNHRNKIIKNLDYLSRFADINIEYL